MLSEESEAVTSMYSRHQERPVCVRRAKQSNPDKQPEDERDECQSATFLPFDSMKTSSYSSNHTSTHSLHDLNRYSYPTNLPQRLRHESTLYIHRIESLPSQMLCNLCRL